MNGQDLLNALLAAANAGINLSEFELVVEYEEHDFHTGFRVLADITPTEFEITNDSIVLK